MNGMQSHRMLPVGRAQQQRALADGELRHRTDADQAGLVLPVAIEMPARERIERGPFLPAGRDELTLVLTDRDMPGGGSSDGVNWLPQVSQRKAGMCQTIRDVRL